MGCPRRTPWFRAVPSENVVDSLNAWLPWTPSMPIEIGSQSGE